MKKIIIFLMTITMVLISNISVYAETFHEAEYIDNVYMRMYQNSTMKYQKARFFRRDSDNKEVYCLQPFMSFDYTKNYYNNNIMNSNLWQKINLISHFGYGYGNHVEPKWYAITQNMIWKTVEPQNTFYFTDTLNGNITNKYDNEINEINSLINRYNTTPKFQNVYYAPVGSSISIIDNNNVLSDYYIKSKNYDARINGNTIIIDKVEEGKNFIVLGKDLENERSSAIYYYSNESQDLLKGGNIGTQVSALTVIGTTNKITITKIDADNKNSIPRGDGELKNTKIGLYNDKNELIEEYILDETLSKTIENLEYGKYYIQEISPGNGYTINDNKYYFNVDMNTKNIDITIDNKIIEKEITIHKEYGSKNQTINEPDISFDIFNKNNELVDTITTDISGNAKIKLPYGKYRITQRNTSRGYNKADDFEIVIDDSLNDDYYYNLYDYKIEVPDTGIKENNSFILLLFFIIPVIYKMIKYAN